MKFRNTLNLNFPLKLIFWVCQTSSHWIIVSKIYKKTLTSNFPKKTTALQPKTNPQQNLVRNKNNAILSKNQQPSPFLFSATQSGTKTGKSLSNDDFSFPPFHVIKHCLWRFLSANEVRVAKLPIDFCVDGWSFSSGDLFICLYFGNVKGKVVESVSALIKLFAIGSFWNKELFEFLSVSQKPSKTFVLFQFNEFVLKANTSLNKILLRWTRKDSKTPCKNQNT